MQQVIGCNHYANVHCDLLGPMRLNVLNYVSISLSYVHGTFCSTCNVQTHTDYATYRRVYD